MTSLQYLLNFAPTLDNLKSFQWTRNWGILEYTDQLQHWIFFEENLSPNFGLIAVFVKVAFHVFSKSRKSTWV